MVQNFLNRCREQPFSLLRRHQKTALSALAIGSIGFVVLGWSLIDGRILSFVFDRPSLLELLDQVSEDKGTERKPSPLGSVPVAPLSRSWRSPLARQCSSIDKGIRSRLLSLQKRSGSWRTFVPIDSTNFGKRFSEDAFGRRLDASPRVIVLHETVYSVSSAVNTFQTPHPRDEDQVSYHTLISRDGRVLDLVDPLMRAYGAGYSAFLGEWAITNKRLKGSVNNFALHLSLETPSNGGHGGSGHSGYSSQQYDALALVLSGWMKAFNLSPTSVTTHRHVDIGGERADPRSFDWSALQGRLAALGDLCVP